MSTNLQNPNPSIMTPFAATAKSIQPALITLSQGLVTFTSDFFRSSNQAKMLNNLQQTRRRGAWTNRDIGWLPWRATVYNSSHPGFLEFANFIDSTNRETLLMQVGDILKSLTMGPDANPIPCNTNSTTTSILFTDAAPAGTYLGGKVTVHTRTGVDIAITGDTVSGGVHTLTVTAQSPAITNTDTISITQDILTGLNTVDIPTIRMFQSNANAASPVGIYVSPDIQPQVIPSVQPMALETALMGGTPYTANYANTITLTGTVLNGQTYIITFTSTSIAGGSTTVTATADATQTLTHMAALITTAINANTTLTGLGFVATSNAGVITITYPQTLAPLTLGYSGTNSHTTLTTGTAAASDILTLTITSASITGSPVALAYSVVTNDTPATSAVGLAALINNNANLTAAGISAIVSGALISIVYPANIPHVPTFAFTLSSTVLGSETCTLALQTASPLMLNANTDPTQFGSTTAPLPVRTYSKPKFCEQFYNRMVYAGFSGTNTSRDILICNAGSYNTVTQSTPLIATDGGIISVDPLIGAISGLRRLRLNNQANNEVLLVAGTKGVAIIQGTDATNFGMITLTLEYGIPTNRSWIPLMNDLWFFTTNGMRSFSSLITNSTLINGTLTYDLQDIINRVNNQAYPQVHACHNLPTQEIQLWLPLDQVGATPPINQNALIANYNSGLGTPTEPVPIWSTKNGTSMACSIFHKGQFWGGGYDGNLQKHYQGNLYNTTAPVCGYLSPLLSQGNPALQQSIRKFLILTEGDGQQFIANMYVYERMDNGTMRRRIVTNNFPLSAPEAASTTLGSWKLGFASFPSSHVKTIEFMPEEHGFFEELELILQKPSDFIDLLGFEVLYSGGGTR